MAHKKIFPEIWWTCDWCGEDFESETETIEHEENCEQNPENNLENDPDEECLI